MNFARHSISATAPVLIFDSRFDPDCRIFTTCTQAGFAVYSVWPLKLLHKRDINGGTLAMAVPLHTSSIIFLVGGGRSPRYPPNKVVFWDDAKGCEVAELEFRERVRGIACRREWVAVALRRRVVVFKFDTTIERVNEWDTYDNPRGLLAMATGADTTLLAIPGRQIGHVQLIHLPPCRSPEPIGPPPSIIPPPKPPTQPKPSASIIVAHTTALTTLSVPISGRYLATTSSRGTLIRIWNTITGKLVKELRRGSDKAEIYGVAFRPDERDVCVWSDKGTVHVFSLVGGSGGSNRQSTFSPLTPWLPLPKYFDSEWSYAQYRIPSQSAHIYLNAPPPKPSTADVVDEEKCVVGWTRGPISEENPEIEEYQLIALTYTGGWYRLSLPVSSAPPRAISPTLGSPGPASLPPPSLKDMKEMSRARSSSGSSIAGRTERGKGKERDREKEGKESRDCVLHEFRRYGRWDGWG